MFEVLAGLGGALLGGERDSDLAPGARHPVDLELESPDGLGDFHFVLGELNRGRASNWAFLVVKLKSEFLPAAKPSRSIRAYFHWQKPVRMISLSSSVNEF